MRKIRYKEITKLKVIGTTAVNTFVKGKEFAMFLRNKRVSAIRALELNGFRNLFAGSKSLTTDLALALTITAIFIVKIMMSGPSKRARNIIMSPLT